MKRAPPSENTNHAASAGSSAPPESGYDPTRPQAQACVAPERSPAKVESAEALSAAAGSLCVWVVDTEAGLLKPVFVVKSGTGEQ